jgi:predicted AlkP superfamily pyrophosphatase or phosphodiesterase
VISFDGLEAVEYLDPTRCPGERRTLSALMHSGVYARGVAGVQPPLTYSSHATIVTGAPPARHGVLTNARPRDRAPWHFDRSDIHAQTFWDTARSAGLRVAIVTWASTNGAEAIYLIPENLSSVPDVTTRVKNASAPGLFDRLKQRHSLFSCCPLTIPTQAARSIG